MEKESKSPIFGVLCPSVFAMPLLHPVAVQFRSFIQSEFSEVLDATHRSSDRSGDGRPLTRLARAVPVLIHLPHLFIGGKRCCALAFRGLSDVGFEGRHRSEPTLALQRRRISSSGATLFCAATSAQFREGPEIPFKTGQGPRRTLGNS
jgi:hypothetical protein